MGIRVLPAASSSTCNDCCQWLRASSSSTAAVASSSSSGNNTQHVQKKNLIPKDVPRGHMVVYVGQHLKRYVIKISLLKHPLFKALLDQAQEDEYYDYTNPSKLCIPCDETMFLDVIRCASSPQDRRIRFCL